MTEPVVNAASQLIASAALQSGMRLERLSSRVVIAHHAGSVIAFTGMAGTTSSRFAHAMCKNAEALRCFLAARQIPVAASNAVPERTLAVVGQDVVAVAGPPSGAVPHEFLALARRTVSAIPGLAYAAVTIGIDQGREGEPSTPGNAGVMSVDPQMSPWSRSAADDDGLTVAQAIATLEFSG